MTRIYRDRPACHALIVGSRADPHVESVINHLRPEGVVVVDAASMDDVLVELSLEGATLRDLAGRVVQIDADNSCVGWIRRLAPVGWDAGAVLGSRRSVVLAARLSALWALIRDPAIRWLSSPDNLAAGENKMVQYRAAIAVGLHCPPTMIASSSHRLGEAFGGSPVVMKPIGPGSFFEDGQEYVTHAQLVDVERLHGADMVEAPFLAQERLLAKEHLRIVTIRDKAWTSSLPALGLPLDWRASASAHTSFTTTDATTGSTASATAGALELADELCIGFSSQDWIVSEQGAFILDVNPGGQWLFLPPEVGAAVSHGLAEWLDQGRSQ